MEKHLNKIVIVAVIIIVVFMYLIIDMMLDRNKPTQVEVLPENSEAVEVSDNKEDYVISQSIQIYPDTSAQIGDASRILGVLESFIFENDEVAGFNILDSMNNMHELKVSNMRLINLEYDGENEVNLKFRTGGYSRLLIGGYIYLYKSADGSYSLDERVQHGGTIETMTGTITDFEFVSMNHQNSHIMLSYIVLDNGSGQTAKLPISLLNTQSIMTSGTMTVYYVGETESGNVYNVNESDDFFIQITDNDGGQFTYQKGTQMDIQKSSAKGYWELKKDVDTSQQRAIVSDIIFGHDGKNINSVDYLVLTLNDGSQDYMTLMHTLAVSGKPFGNYVRTYTADGNDIVINDVDPYQDFRLELYYNGGVEVVIKVGTEVWIQKNNDGIYELDYEYTYSMQESQK